MVIYHPWLMMRIIIVISVFFVYISAAFAIDCYQCESTGLVNPYQCNEYMDDSDLQAKPCDSVYNAAYCIKQTGRFEGGLGTKRFCSSLDLGSYCNFIRQPGDPFEYRSCVYTCSSDGCNHSNSISINKTSALILLVLLYLLNSFELI